MKSSCGKAPLSRRKSALWEGLRLMKFQAHVSCEVPKRERNIYKLNGNFDRPSFQAVIHLFMLRHLMVRVHCLFGASVVLLGELLSPKSPFSAIFLVREKHLYQSLRHREALPLFPFLAHQTLFTLFSPSSFLRGFCEFSHQSFPLFISLPSLAMGRNDKQEFFSLSRGTLVNERKIMVLLHCLVFPSFGRFWG